MTSAQKPFFLLPSQIAFQAWLLLAFPFSQVKFHEQVRLKVLEYKDNLQMPHTQQMTFHKLFCIWRPYLCNPGSNMEDSLG